MAKKKNKTWIYLGVGLAVYLFIGLIASQSIHTSVAPLWKVLFYPIFFLSGNTGNNHVVGDPNLCYNQIDVSAGNPSAQFCICMGGNYDVEDTAQGQVGKCYGILYGTTDAWDVFCTYFPNDRKYTMCGA